MKLGLVVPGGFDPSGREGTIPALLALARQLARRHEVRVFAASGRSGAGRYRVAEVEVTQVAGARPRRGLRGALDLGAAFERWARAAGPFDLLHAFWADRGALLAALHARRRGIPAVVSVGGGEAVWLPDIGYGGAGTRGGRLITRAALGLADAVTAGSAFAAAGLSPALAARAEIVPLGVDAEAYAAPPARAPGPPWRLLHVANLNLVKDQATLLAALRLVVDRLDVRLDCVGEDTLGGEIQRRAGALGLAQRVTFHGAVPSDELPRFYRAAHLQVMASRHESQGVTVLEAAAAGLPTVGTGVGLLPTLAPEAARVVPVGDAAALAGAIGGLLLDAAAREAMGAAAQRFARAHDLAATARTFEAIYARTTAPAGRRR